MLLEHKIWPWEWWDIKMGRWGGPGSWKALYTISHMTEAMRSHPTKTPSFCRKVVTGAFIRELE